jgi:BirA family transcriptional regulator, biotin operon repressor / biotin---[acetyl-CoA-carboxylase] ligase
MCLSVSLCQSLEDLTPLRPAIKWPNDLLIADRKVCGVLAESTDAAPGYVAVGLGLNVAWRGFRPAEVPTWATALDEHVSSTPPRESLLMETVIRIDKWLTALGQTSEHERLRNEWQGRLWRRGQTVTVKLHDRAVQGVLQGTDPRGALELLSIDGEMLTILDGELLLPDRLALNQG